MVGLEQWKRSAAFCTTDGVVNCGEANHDQHSFKQHDWLLHCGEMMSRVLVVNNDFLHIQNNADCW